MFGRYELPLWRRVVGLLLALWFVLGFYNFVTDMVPDHPGSNTSPGWIDSQASPSDSCCPTR